MIVQRRPTPQHAEMLLRESIGTGYDQRRVAGFCVAVFCTNRSDTTYCRECREVRAVKQQLRQARAA